MQAVVLQQHAAGRASFTGVAHELVLVGQLGNAAVFQRHDQVAALDGVAGGTDVRALLQRCGAIQHVACVFDDLLAALGFVALWADFSHNPSLRR